jgi:hypothetical protein
MIDELDRSLERWLRAAVPLPASAAEIGFDHPQREWETRRSVPLVDLFLYSLGPSKERAATGTRVVPREDGGLARVREVPVIEARYLISIWGGGAAVEHDLLGRVMRVLAASRTIPSEHLSDALRAVRPPMYLSLAPDESTSATQLWSALSIPPRPAVQLLVETPVGLPMPYAVNDPPSALELSTFNRRLPAARSLRRHSFERVTEPTVRAGRRGAVIEDSARGGGEPDGTTGPTDG